MKLKLRFNPDAIKEAIANHLEKGLFAVVVVFVLVFVVGAVSREPLGFTPAALEGDAKRAREHLLKANPKDIVSQLKSPNYLEEAHRSWRKIEVKPYEWSTPWDPSLFGIPLPSVPQVYTVQGLVASAGSGVMTAPVSPTTPKPATVQRTTISASTTVGQRWVVLTGLIDFTKQVEAFKEAFSGTIVARAVGTAGLDPQYLYVRVQRIEVPDDGKIDESKWEWLKTDEMCKLAGQRPAGGSQTYLARAGAVQGEVVDSGFLTDCQFVTFPLPAVRDHRWGPEVAHPPEILPRADMIEQLAEENEQAEEGEGPDHNADGHQPEVRDPFAPPDAAMPAPTGGGPLAGGTRPRTPVYGPGAAINGQMPPPRFGGPRGPAAEQLGPQSVRLFRFFDFSVEPGKRYRYRVTLVLKNPAENLPQQQMQLIPEELTKSYLKSEWSEPSTVISVPRDSRLLVGPVKSSRSLNIEPSSTLMLVHFDGETGVESSLELPEVLRGQLVNYIKETEITKSEVQHDERPTDRTRTLGAPPSREDKKERRRTPPTKEVHTTQFDVEDLVLDMRGGDRLSSRLSRPGSMLLLGADGNLIVRDELDDAQSIVHYKPPEPPPETGPAPPNAGPGSRDRLPPRRQAPPPRRR